MNEARMASAERDEYAREHATTHVDRGLQCERETEVFSFQETSKRVRVQKHKEKLLYQERERFGELKPDDLRVQLMTRITAKLQKILPDLTIGASHLLQSPDINAFALRGDADIFVCDGILRQYVTWCTRNNEAPSEDAFAFIFAHEIGHVRQGTQEANPTEEKEDEAKKHDHQERLNDEYDADRFGLQAMARAGYNPREGLKMLKFLESLDEGLQLPSTHPRSADRARELTALVESPDTIMPNTDTIATKLPQELVKVLEQEDPRRPGTALYRQSARKNLGTFLRGAERIPDVLEVLCIAQLHRHLEEVDRLRRTEAARSRYAQYLTLRNVESILKKMENVYWGTRSGRWGELEKYEIPTATTRYVVREFAYTGSEVATEDPTDESVLKLGALQTEINHTLSGVLRGIERSLKENARRQTQERAGSEKFIQYEEYTRKLEYIRANIQTTVDTVDHDALQSFVENVKINPKTDWIHTPQAAEQILTSSGEELLRWCARDGSAFFSRVVHASSAHIRDDSGDTLGNDDRYQAYLPEHLRTQHDVTQADGRAAFLEECLFQAMHDSVRQMPNSLYRIAYLNRTERHVLPLFEDLQASLIQRYAGLSCAAEVARAMAISLLTDGAFDTAEFLELLPKISEVDEQMWLKSITPLSLEFSSSANALFLGETGMGAKKLGGETSNIYQKFFHIEKYCLDYLQARAIEHGRFDRAAVINQLHIQLIASDSDARSEIVKEIGHFFAQESWENLDVAQLEERLSSTFVLMNQYERKDVLQRIFKFEGDDNPYFIIILSYAMEVSPQYAQGLFDFEWKQLLAKTSDDERLALLRNAYSLSEHYQGPMGSYDSQFIKKTTNEYLSLVIAREGDVAFVNAFEDLIRRKIVYKEEGAPIFGSEALQRRFESLPQQEFHRLVLACKETDPSGTSLGEVFLNYITVRVLGECGVVPTEVGKDRWENVTFDTSRPFVDVFTHIGNYVTYRFARTLLSDCLKAYDKQPMDTVIEGLDRYYEPIPRASVKTGGSANLAWVQGGTVDDYAKRYDPQARPFYEDTECVFSDRRIAIRDFVRETAVLQDHSKTVLQRMRIVLELVPEQTDFRDMLFAEIEQDFLAEHGIPTEGHRLLLDPTQPEHRVLATLAYALYTEALPHMVDQVRMQHWGRRADALYREFFAGREHPTLEGELARIERLYPTASFARDEALLRLGDSTLVRTPEQARRVQSMLTEMQRQTHDANTLTGQSMLERCNVLVGNLSRAEKKDFILWTIGAEHAPPKSLRAYGGMQYVSFEEVPQFVFAATAQEREHFFLRIFMGSSGLFEPQNPEDEKVLDAFILNAFDKIFPDNDIEGVTGQSRQMLERVFRTVLTEYDPYRRGKIFIGMVESLRDKQTAGRGEKIAALMNELGPVFIKVGQVLSETKNAADEYILPEDIRQAMKKMKQSAKRFHRIAAIYSLESANEFADGNPNRIAYTGETIAAASIKQVNEAVRIDGRESVEKVLRPSIEKHLAEDIRVLRVIVDRLREVTTVPKGIENIGATYVREEADFIREVENTKKMAKALEEYGRRRVIRKMPVRTTEVYSYSKTHIQEEKVHGVSLEELEAIAEDPKTMDALQKKYRLSPSDLTKYVGMIPRLSDMRLQAFDALAYQYFQADTFHSDPHAGNMKITPDGELVFIDNGSVGETQQTDRNNLKTFFLGFALQQPDTLKAAVTSLTKGLTEQNMAEIVDLATGPLNDAEKLSGILTIVTEQAKELDPAFNKFLKSLETGLYLMSGLHPEDVRMILGAYTQGDKGSLRAYAATAIARAAQERPHSRIGQAVRKIL